MFRLTQHKTLIVPHFVAVLSGLALLGSSLIDYPVTTKVSIADPQELSQAAPCPDTAVSYQVITSKPATQRSWAFLYIF